MPEKSEICIFNITVIYCIINTVFYAKFQILLIIESIAVFMYWYESKVKLTTYNNI